MNLSFDEDKIKTVKNWLGKGSVNIFGMPLSGKDTQCQKLAELLDANTFGGGEILRSTKVSDKLKSNIDNGMLAPTEEYKQKVIPYFNKPEYQGKPLVLSSVGRWIGEETSVFKAAKSSNHPMKAAIFLNLNQEESLKRIRLANRGRVDDDQSILNKRFEEYINKTYPVLDVYRNKNLLLEVNGMQSEDQVTKNIVDMLYQKAKQNK